MTVALFDAAMQLALLVLFLAIAGYALRLVVTAAQGGGRVAGAPWPTPSACARRPRPTCGPGPRRPARRSSS